MSLLFALLGRILETAFFIEHAVSGAKDGEFCPSVELVTDFLLLLIFKGCDERFGQLCTFFEPRIAFSLPFRYLPGLVLTIADRRQAVGRDAMRDEIVDYGLGPSL